jgi:flagellar operon protein
MSIGGLEYPVIHPTPPVSGKGPAQVPGPGETSIRGGDFKSELNTQLSDPAATSSAKETPPLKIEFSNHAVDRMRQRGIHYTPDQLQKIDSAVSKASEKGAKETLILVDNSAMIVSVKNNKVVTVMDKEALKDNVFTKIDSTVVI